MLAARASAASLVCCRVPGTSSTAAPWARICTVLAGLVEAGAMITARMPPAAAYAATAAPPLPLLSSRTSWIPCCRSRLSITLAPRSLKLPVGMNHSHFRCAVPPCSARRSSGVQPSPIVIGASTCIGSAAA